MFVAATPAKAEVRRHCFTKNRFFDNHDRMTYESVIIRMTICPSGLQNKIIIEIIRIFRTLTKFRIATISFVTSIYPSVHPHGTTRFPLDGFSSNFGLGWGSSFQKTVDKINN